MTKERYFNPKNREQKQIQTKNKKSLKQKKIHREKCVDIFDLGEEWIKTSKVFVREERQSNTRHMTTLFQEIRFRKIQLQELVLLNLSYFFLIIIIILCVCV